MRMTRRPNVGPHAVALLCVGLLLALAAFPSLRDRTRGRHVTDAGTTSPGVRAIVPGAAWTASDGNLAQLRAVGTVMNVGGTFYAWGENMINGLVFTAITCYSSTDLVSWHREPDALSLQASGELGPNRAVGRPSVLYNATTHKYVMWLHIDTPHLYDEAKVGVAESTTPCGPYTYLGSTQPYNHQSRDINVFQDTDGTAYLLTEDRTSGLRIDRLSPDYESVDPTATDSVKVLTDHEAPAMVKVGDTYYLFASHLTSLATNDNEYTTTTSLSQNWSSWKTFAPVGTHTFDSQISSVLTVAGTAGTTYMFIGDRWNDNDLYDSSAIWLPLTISGGTATLDWVPSWTLDVAAGTWSPQTRSDTYEAGGVTSSLSGSAAVTPCTGCTGESVVSGLAPGPVTYTYDDTASQLTYTGTWTHSSGTTCCTGDYDTTKSFASAAGSSMSVSFTGSTIRLIGLHGPNYGKATISVDGTQVATVDAYASTQQHLQVLYSTSSRTNASHVLTVTLTGTNTSPSTATYFSIDAIDLHSTDQQSPAGGDVTVSNVQADATGRYTVLISYVNSQTTDQYASVSANGGTPVAIAFPPTTDGNTTGTAVAALDLATGANTIRIAASGNTAPEIDTISIP